MKRAVGVVKGTPSGLMISLAIHLGAFLLAGAIVVITVNQDEEIIFIQPPKAEVHKMDLKKMQPMNQKTAKPKASTPIIATMKAQRMPIIEIPTLPASDGDAILGDIGIQTIVPDLDKVTKFGGSKSIGNDLEGVLYDFKRFRNGTKNNAYDMRSYVEKFIRSGWKTSSISPYYRSPKKLYTPMVMVPPTESTLGPWAFGERDMDPWAYMLHYKGQLTHKKGIKFRFVAMADNFLVIRVNGKVVLDYKNQFEAAIPGKPFKPQSYHFGHWYTYASDWIELEAGKSQDIEMILGEYSGVIFAAMVAVEVYGEEYPNAPLPQDNPQLPIFKTARLTTDQVDTVYEGMWKDHLQVTSGPIFCDYDDGAEQGTNSSAVVLVSNSEPSFAINQKPGTQLWTLKDGDHLDAEFVKMFSQNVVLKTTHGKTIKRPLSDFSDGDIERLVLLNPPKLKLSFKKDTKQFKVRSNPEMDTSVPVATEFAGGVVIEQSDRQNKYQRPLRLELYVILDEFDGENFILHDRQTQDFMLTSENKQRFELYGRKDIMLRYEHYNGKVRGEKFKGYMILVLNEKNEIIAQNLSHDWLFDIRDELLQFPIGRHFNKQGERVHPPRPMVTDKYWDHEP